MSEIVWENPPKQVREADRVAAQLRAKPGEWAMIATSPGLEFMPWWGPIYNSPAYETKFVRDDPKKCFGPRRVYARFAPASPESEGSGGE